MLNTELVYPSQKEIDGLIGKVSTTMKFVEKVMNTYKGKDVFGLTGTIKEIKDCKPEYKKFGFPIRSLGYVLNDLCRDLKTIEAHSIVQNQREIHEIITSFRRAPPKEPSHQKMVA